VFLYAASRLKVYDTFSVSPLTTLRSPGESKSASENRMPEVPLATVQINAPATVAVLVIANDDGEPVLSMTEGAAVVGVPKVTALREPE
jgi:hypothetical protein